MTMMDLSLFEKIDTRPRNGVSARGGDFIKMHKKGHRTLISANIVAQLGWKKDDKVDLYKLGNTYALKRDVAGCMKLNNNSGGAKRGSTPSLSICNQQLWLNTVPHKGDVDEFHAWVEGDVVFFKRTAENV